MPPVKTLPPRVGSLEVGEEIRPGLHRVTCVCGTPETRTRSSLLGAVYAGRKSCCSKCQIETKRFNHALVVGYRR